MPLMVMAVAPLPELNSNAEAALQPPTSASTPLGRIAHPVGPQELYLGPWQGTDDARALSSQCQKAKGKFCEGRDWLGLCLAGPVAQSIDREQGRALTVAGQGLWRQSLHACPFDFGLLRSRPRIAPSGQQLARRYLPAMRRIQPHIARHSRI